MIICLNQELSEQSVECASSTPTQLLWKLLAKSGEGDGLEKTQQSTHIHTHACGPQNRKCDFLKTTCPHHFLLLPCLSIASSSISASLSTPLPMEKLTKPKSDTYNSHAHLQDHRDIHLDHSVLSLSVTASRLQVFTNSKSNVTFRLSFFFFFLTA